MKSTLSCILLASFLCLLLPNRICAEDEFKADFGRQMGNAFKDEIRKLSQSIVEAAEEFYKTVQKDVALSPEQADHVKRKMSSLEEVKAKTSADSSTKMIDGITIFVKNIRNDVRKAEANAKIEDPSEVEKVRKAVSDFSKKEDEAIDKFAAGLQAKWTEKYNTIPEAEKQKEPGYARISELIENADKIEKNPADHNKARRTAARQTVHEIVDFFGYTEWNDFFARIKSSQ